ncbi:MAG: RidA family protein [Pseudomonadota bacterium]
MSAAINDRLKQMGIQLPSPAAPAANYVPYTQSGNILIISGQLPMVDGKLAYTGKLGQNVTLETGVEAAKACAINILAQANAALGGDLGRVTRCLRLGGFVASTPDFTQHPQVINGASNFMVEVLGDAGKHARAAVGVAALPFDAAVEVDAMFEVA